MKIILTIFLAFTCLSLPAQQPSHKKEIKAFQKELNVQYRSPTESPLPSADRKKFKRHKFFKINKAFRIKAKFTRTKDAVPFEMKTTTSRAPIYEKYGTATFEFEGKAYKLTLYQSHQSRDSEEYKDYLFLPFKDWTNGDDSYGGGRFIDLLIPEGDTVIIDFNKAYNPYCAYSYRYSCPIPPQENALELRVEAGVKLEAEH